MSATANPFAQFSGDDRASIREQLLRLRSSQKLSNIQSFSVARALAQLDAAEQSTGEALAPPGGMQILEPAPLSRRIAAGALNLLPAAGATAGGIIGGAGGGGVPGGLAGAGVGGAGGESLRQLIGRAVFGGGPETSGQAARGIVSQGAMGVATQAGGGVITKAAGSVARGLKAGALRNVEALLAPSGDAAKIETQRLAPKLLEKLPVAMTRGGFEAKVAGRMAEANANLDTLWANLPANVTVSTKPMLEALEAFKGHFQAKVGIRTLSLGPLGEKGVAAINKLQKTVRNWGPRVSAKDLRSIRQNLDTIVDEAKGFTKDDVTKTIDMVVTKELTNSARRELAKEVPDLAALNAEYHLYRGVSELLKARRLRETGQHLSFLEKVAGGTGALAGGIAGGYGAGIPGMLAGAATTGGTLVALSRLVNSAAWKTVGAATKNQIASALAVGNYPQANAIALRVLGAAVREGQP